MKLQGKQEMNHEAEREREMGFWCWWKHEMMSFIDFYGRLKNFQSWIFMRNKKKETSPSFSFSFKLFLLFTLKFETFFSPFSRCFWKKKFALFARNSTKENEKEEKFDE